MAKFKIVGLFSCENALLDKHTDEEAKKMLRNMVEAAIRAYFNNVYVSLSKCERIKEE